jgi:hypothetical protein
MAIRWDKFTVKAQEAVQRAERDRRGTWQSGNSARTFASRAHRGPRRHRAAGTRKTRRRSGSGPF